jgi:ABC-type branched-subunit amino acid transport system substrate-binding protein
MSLHRKSLALVAVAFVMLVVAGCGSSSSGSSGGSSSGGGSSAGSGGKAPIKLMVLGAVQAPGFSDPELPLGAQVAASQLNAQGGINGHPVQIIVCNDKNSPNVATQCALQAVHDKVAAMVGGFTLFEAEVVPIIQRAGIPWLGPTPISNFTSPSYFILGGDPASSYFALASAFVSRGCTKIGAVAEDFPAAHQAEKLFALGVLAAKGHLEGAVYAPQNSADWGPPVSSATSEGDDCIGMVTAPASAAKIIVAAKQSGKALTVGSIDQIIPGTLVKQLGANADGVLSTSGFPPFTSNQPGIVKLGAAAHKLDPSAPLDDFVANGYVGVELVADAAKGLTAVNAATLMAALPKITAYNTGLGPVLNLSKPNPAAAFSRVFNTKVYVVVAKGGAYQLASTKPVDALPAFEAAAAATK